jgi:NO-binding membrane sensor protein with MHYT domain
MSAIWTSLTDRNDPRLLAVALVICLVSGSTGLAVYARAASAVKRPRVSWSAFAALATGSGVGATRVLCTLVYGSQVTLADAVNLTALSLLAGLAILFCGVFTVARGRGGSSRLVGGALAGGAVAAMHFLGVGALNGPAGSAVAIALLACGVAIAAGGGGSRLRRILTGAAIFGAVPLQALASMHA